jgi:hypothetical protein
MSATAVGRSAAGKTGSRSWEPYKGWVIGLVIIVIVLAIGAGLWFYFHP